MGGCASRPKVLEPADGRPAAEPESDLAGTPPAPIAGERGGPIDDEAKNEPPLIDLSETTTATTEAAEEMDEKEKEQLKETETEKEKTVEKDGEGLSKAAEDGGEDDKLLVVAAKEHPLQ